MEHVLRLHDIVKTDMVRADGCLVYDERGRAYIDFEAGVWCANLGHGHPRILKVIRTQSQQLLHVGYRYTTQRAEEAASTVLETLGRRDGKCVFLSSGSEAVELALTIARWATGRHHGLSLSGAYLSAYGSAGVRTAEDWCTFDWEACEDCPRRERCDPSCDRLRTIPFDSIAGFVFESGNMHGTVRFPPSGMVRQIADQLRRAGGLVVANEITTGMGRTGTWFGFEHYGLAPEIVALGKGLGNGYPVSAVAMSADAAKRVESTGVRYVQSHQNDPLACAVAREVIAVIRSESLVERSRRVGESFLDRIRRLASETAGVCEARGRGLMIVLEFCPDCLSAASVYARLLREGFLVGLKEDANLIRFYPPLTIEEESIDRLLAVLEAIFAEIAWQKEEEA